MNKSPKNANNKFNVKMFHVKHRKEKNDGFVFAVLVGFFGWRDFVYDRAGID